MDFYNLLFNVDPEGLKLTDAKEGRFVTLEDGRVVFIGGPSAGGGANDAPDIPGAYWRPNGTLKAPADKEHRGGAISVVNTGGGGRQLNLHASIESESEDMVGYNVPNQVTMLVELRKEAESWAQQYREAKASGPSPEVARIARARDDALTALAREIAAL